MWIFIGVGIASCTCADAAFAVQESRGVGGSSHYDFVWTLGALFIAYAAWVRSPSVHEDERQVTGMRAIALALIAQAIAIAIQITAVFKELGKSERIVTALVLVFASVQIILTRPKPEAAADEAAPHDNGPIPATKDDPGPADSSQFDLIMINSSRGTSGHGNDRTRTKAQARSRPKPSASG